MFSTKYFTKTALILFCLLTTNKLFPQKINIVSEDNGIFVLKNFWSDNIIIKTSKDNLIHLLGSPDTIITREERINKKKYDSFFYEKLGLVYVSYGDSVQLHLINFKINKKAKIYYDNICFDRHLRFNKIVKIFDLDKEYHNLYSACAPFSKDALPKQYYLFNPSINVKPYIYMEIAFNKYTKKLEFIDFGYSNVIICGE
jgi:hypothetical protein